MLMLTRLAPGAAPCILVPSERVTSRPATMPLTCIPCPPPETRSVSAEPASTGAQVLSVNGSHTILRFLTTAEVPSAFCRNGWVGSTPESMTATETPLPSRLVPSAPVRVARASLPRVAVLDVESSILMGWLPST